MTQDAKGLMESCGGRAEGMDLLRMPREGPWVGWYRAGKLQKAGAQKGQWPNSKLVGVKKGIGKEALN